MADRYAWALRANFVGFPGLGVFLGFFGLLARGALGGLGLLAINVTQQKVVDGAAFFAALFQKSRCLVEPAGLDAVEHLHQLLALGERHLGLDIGFGYVTVGEALPELRILPDAVELGLDADRGVGVKPVGIDMHLTPGLLLVTQNGDGLRDFHAARHRRRQQEAHRTEHTRPDSVKSVPGPAGRVMTRPDRVPGSRCVP